MYVYYCNCTHQANDQQVEEASCPHRGLLYKQIHYYPTHKLADSQKDKALETGLKSILLDLSRKIIIVLFPHDGCEQTNPVGL